MRHRSTTTGAAARSLRMSKHNNHIHRELIRHAMLTQHPLGKLLPAMSAEEYEYTKADIQKHGQRDAIILLDGKVLDGWHRYRICLDLGIEPRVKTLGKRADALAEVLTRNLARRQLSPGQRYGVLLRIAEEYPEVAAGLAAVRADAKKRQAGGVPQQRQRSSEVIGRLAGVGHATVERVDRLKKLSPTLFEQMVDGKVPLPHAVLQAAMQARREKQDALRAPPGAATESRLVCGDFREVIDAGTLPPISLMWADLPWDRATLGLWDDVGRVAASVLRPGGVLAAYPGKVFVPDVMAALGRHLTFQWPCAMFHNEVESCQPKRVMTKWAPLLLYVRGTFDPPIHPLDVVESESKERDRHQWQRPLAEYLHFIKYLTRPGEWVLDVTGGSFASGKAAKLLGRNYVGVDIDPEAVAKGREWVKEVM